MKVAFRESFARDIKKRRQNSQLLSRIREIILEVEAAENLAGVPRLKRLKADGPYYRIRTGNYRLGLIIEAETVNFVRVLHRRDIYRHFPYARRSYLAPVSTTGQVARR